MNAEEQELSAIEGIGPTIAASVAAFFRDEQNRTMIDKLRSAGLCFTAEKQVSDGQGPLSGFSVVFTGELESMTRSEAEEIVRRLGGSTTSRVSGKTNLLVVGANPGSKFDEARKRGIQVVDEEKFISMVKEAGADV